MVELRNIQEDNLWWRLGKEFYKYDPDLSSIINDILFQRKDIRLETGSVYSIEGPRRVGKTVWIKKKILDLIKEGINPKNICYFNCDRISSRRELRKVLRTFMDISSNPIIFLDEINSVKEWEKELKAFLDIYRNKVTILITGSPFDISEKVPYLSGRGLEGNRYFMKPFSFRRFLINLNKPKWKHKNEYIEISGKRVGFGSILYSLHQKGMIDEEKLVSTVLLIEKLRNIKIELKDYEEIYQKSKEIIEFSDILDFWFKKYLFCGGFPKLMVEYLTKGRISNETYEEITTWILKDVESRVHMKSFLKEIIKRVSSRTSIPDIANTIDMEKSLAYEYLRTLEKKFIIFVLNSLDAKLDERERGLKKIYFLDHGFMLGLKSMLEGRREIFDGVFESVMDDTFRGKIVENIVATSILNFAEIPREFQGRRVHFLYEGDKEVDLVFDKKIFIEVKYRTKFRKFRGILLTKDEFEREKWIKIPVYIFLALLEENERHL